MEQNIAFALSLVTMSAALAAYIRAKSRTAAVEARLNNLRANCYLTTELGHRTRYANASPEVRARAETTNERTTNG